MAKKSAKKTKRPAKKVTRKPAKKPASKKAASTRSAAKKTAPKKAAKKTEVKAEPKKMVINPYLTFPGNCEEAFNFYRSVFGGKFNYVGRFKEMPAMDGMTVPESEKEKIMHISLPISKETILMGSDSSEAFGHATTMGTNFSIFINAVSKASADKLYNNLSNGGQQTMPMSQTFWGSYYGMLTDKFGVQWQLSFGE